MRRSNILGDSGDWTDDSDINTQDYFDSFEEVITPDEEKEARETLDKITQNAYNIRQEVNKPHKCGPNCICKVLNVQLDLLNAHITNMRGYINGKQQRQT